MSQVNFARTRVTAVSLDGLIESVCNEAIVLRPYLDSKRVWTIGVGHTAAAGGINPKTFNGELTLEQAIELFAADARRYAADVAAAVKVPITQYEFDALFDFHYNTGAIRRASLVKALNEGDRARAAALFMQWKKPPEIIERRARSRELFETGVYKQRFALLLGVTASNRPDWARGRRVDVRALLTKTNNPALAVPVSATPVTSRPVSGPTYITRGATGALVVAWQEQLLALGYRLSHGADGDFGDETLRVTKAFQRDAGIMVDGRVGAGTRAAAVKRARAQPTISATAKELVADSTVATTVVTDGSVTISGAQIEVEPAEPVAETVAPAAPVSPTTTTVTVEPVRTAPAYEIVKPDGVPVVQPLDTTASPANPNSGETGIGSRSLKQMGIGAVVVAVLAALLNWIGG